MRYRLVVLTHGENHRLVWGSVAAFARHVKPAPDEAVLYVDGGSPWKAWDVIRHSPWRWTHDQSEAQQGFCRATAAAWRLATDPRGEPPEYVFWLEHDFLIERDVDLRELAFVVDEHRLAQMALMREAVNAAEKAAGGLYESRPGEYAKQHAWFDRFRGDPGQLSTPHEMYERPWLEHSSYFTTNPSLMRRDFMVAHPWPGGEPECEGRYGITLREAGYRFGVWGEGEPWCRHVGVRSGFGY